VSPAGTEGGRNLLSSCIYFARRSEVYSTFKHSLRFVLQSTCMDTVISDPLPLWVHSTSGRYNLNQTYFLFTTKIWFGLCWIFFLARTCRKIMFYSLNFLVNNFLLSNERLLKSFHTQNCDLTMYVNVIEIGEITYKCTVKFLFVNLFFIIHVYTCFKIDTNFYDRD